MSNLTRRSFLTRSALAGAALGVGPGQLAWAQDKVLKVGVVHQGPIADTGWEAFHARAWRAMEAEFGSGQFERGVIAGIEAVSRELARHFPSDGPHSNELPDAPVVM